MSKRKQIDAIPDEFAAADEAAEFWDTHDTTDYPRAFRTIRVVAELRNRHYEISIEADVAETLEARARKAGVTLGHLANDLLRRQLRTAI
ncbi:MAG TPA: CopG family antitoxin [Terriglobia bacterium]|jgi:predicted phosphatase|nr:CopG family antitoxin [Terriglobia bacterium]